MLPFALCLLALLPLVRPAALTIELPASERACFFADVDQLGEKIGSCPSPSPPLPSSSTTGRLTDERSPLGFYFAVQAGGDFLIDFIIQYVPHLSSRCPTSRPECHPTDPTPLPLALARIPVTPTTKLCWRRSERVRATLS